MSETSRRTVLASGLATIATAAVGAAPTGRRSALAQIRPRLQRFVDEGSIAGAVSLVQIDGEIAQLDAVGWRDVASRSPMRENTIFQIMSQSKPYIATSIMMLQDEGRLSIDDPVERYLPSFAQPWLIDGEDEGSRRLRRPKGRITIGQILSHASGLPDGSPSVKAFATKMKYTIGEITGILSQQPLDAEPGTHWRYSNQGIGVAAHIVEIVTGKEYPEFVKERIFAPLGMRESTYRPARAIWPRIASDYQLVDGKLTELGEGTPGYGNLKYRVGTRNSMPEAGIFSTATEVARFHQLFLDRGVWRGRRLLSETAVEQMLTPRIVMSRGGPENAQPSWQGLGWRLIPRDAPGGPTSLPAGSFNHSGAFGSYGWGDPAHGVVGVLLLQRNGANKERDTMIEAVNAALVA